MKPLLCNVQRWWLYPSLKGISWFSWTEFKELHCSSAWCLVAGAQIKELGTTATVHLLASVTSQNWVHHTFRPSRILSDQSAACSGPTSLHSINLALLNPLLSYYQIKYLLTTFSWLYLQRKTKRKASRPAPCTLGHLNTMYHLLVHPEEGNVLNNSIYLVIKQVELQVWVQIRATLLFK